MLILKRATRVSTEQTFMRTKWLDISRFKLFREHLLDMMLSSLLSLYKLWVLSKRLWFVVIQARSPIEITEILHITVHPIGLAVVLLFNMVTPLGEG